MCNYFPCITYLFSSLSGGLDYDSNAQVLIIPDLQLRAANTMQQVVCGSIAIYGDGVDEGNETFNVNLTSATKFAAVISNKGLAIVTILKTGMHLITNHFTIYYIKIANKKNSD